jgi:hypothetical protein
MEQLRDIEQTGTVHPATERHKSMMHRMELG